MRRDSLREGQCGGCRRYTTSEHRGEVVAHLVGLEPLQDRSGSCVANRTHARPIEADLSEVRGQAQAKRALEIAAAGGKSKSDLKPFAEVVTDDYTSIDGYFPLYYNAKEDHLLAVIPQGMLGKDFLKITLSNQAFLI